MLWAGGKRCPGPGSPEEMRCGEARRLALSLRGGRGEEHRGMGKSVEGEPSLGPVRMDAGSSKITAVSSLPASPERPLLRQTPSL